jgi:hypothetical protein
MIIAARGLIDLVEMHVAIAFGASVHPFTNITANVKTTVIISAGLLKNCCKKSLSAIVIVRFLLSLLN